jgi:hypothetical protein
MVSFKIESSVYCVTDFYSGTGGTIATPATGKDSSACGSTVSILATAAMGYRFGAWTSSAGITIANAASASTTLTHTDSASGTVTASFTRLQFTATMVGAGVTPATGTHDSGVVFAITATPADANHYFHRWIGSGGSRITDSLSASTNVYLVANATITATYDSIPTKVIQKYPAANATEIPVSPTFVWYKGRYGSYVLTVATDRELTDVVLEAYNTVNDTDAVGAGVGLVKGVTYYWRVRNYNSTGATNSDTLSFTTGLEKFTVSISGVRATVGAISSPVDSGVPFAISMDSAAVWDSTAAVIWSGTGGAHITNAGLKTTTAWMSANGTITATCHIRIPRVPLQVAPVQSDTLNKNVAFSWNKLIDSVVILTLFSDSGTTVLSRDTTTGNSISKTLTDSTKYFYSIKGGTGTSWSATSGIISFYTLSTTNNNLLIGTAVCGGLGMLLTAWAVFRRKKK